MSVQPIEREDIDLSSLEQMEWEIPCEIPNVAYGSDAHCDYNPAEWIAFRSVICSCGIIVRLVCTDCKVMYQHLMARHAHLTCPGCDEETNGFDRFEPLKQSS